MSRALMLLALFAALTSVAATAQDGDSSKADAAKFDDPDAKSMGTGSESRVVLEAGDADAKATGRLAHLFPVGKSHYGRYSLTVTAPFDSKKADKVDIGTLSGLTAGSSATLELSGLRWDKANRPEQRAMTDVCRKYIPQLIEGYTWDLIDEVTPYGCGNGFFEKEALDELINAVNDRRKGCVKCRPMAGTEPPLCDVLREAQKAHCGALDTSNATSDGEKRGLCALLEKNVREECVTCKDISSGEMQACTDLAPLKAAKLINDPEKLLAQAKAELAPRASAVFRPLSIMTLAIKANTQHFDYVLAEDLATANKSDKGGVGVTLAWTRVLLSSAWSFGYSHEKSYKGQDKVQVCAPIGTDGATSCKETAIGAPKTETSELAFIENRTIITAGRFALAPRIEFDFKKSAWATRLPLYFVANKEKLLTAGLALGYSEAEDEKFGASVFISKAFSFYD